jgi:hypothetical protein
LGLPANKPKKLRLILEVPAKFKEVCFDDGLHNGQFLINDMLEILFFFREKPIGVIMDIKSMFLQVQVHPKDQTVRN